MRGLNLVNLLGGGTGADQGRRQVSLRAAQYLRVLASLSMVAMLTITAGKAKGQVVGGDPTPMSPLMCDGLVIPSNTPFPVPAPGCMDLGPIPSPIGVLGSSAWFDGNSTWTRDRRPMVFIQMGSSSWSNNPRANPDWWWTHLENDPNVLTPDLSRDFGWPNPDMNVSFPRVLYTVPPNGHNTFNGIPDQFDALIREIKLFKSKGFRRIVLHLPAGVNFGMKVGQFFRGQNQSMNQWGGMAQWKREYFHDATGAWQQFVAEECVTDASGTADPNKILLGLYLGSPIQAETCSTQTVTATMPDGSSPVTATSRQPYLVGQSPPPASDPEYAFAWVEPSVTPNPVSMNPRVQSHMDIFHTNIQPWIQAGFREIWLDAGSDNSNLAPNRANLWATEELAHNPYLRNTAKIRIGGETVPTTDNDGLITDDCALKATRWMATGVLMMPTDSDGKRKVRGGWMFDRSMSEVHLVDERDEGLTNSEWWAARRAGLVMSLWNIFPDDPTSRKRYEKWKRWYSYGMIQVADFNGDEEVNVNDQTDLYQAMNNWSPGEVTVFGSGDINQDGTITYADFQEWLDAYNVYLAWEQAGSNPSTKPARVDYGGMDDL